MKREIYLDYAAATPLGRDVLEVMKPYLTDKFYNPSAVYLAAKEVRQTLNEARDGVAKWLGAKPSEIIFTSGATEANNLAIQGIMRRFSGHEILVGSIDHESVIEPARLFKHKEIPVTEAGVVDLTALEKLIGKKTVLISVGLVNNELGTIQPIKEIAKIVNSVRQSRQRRGEKTPLFLHSDAVQAGSFFDLHISRLGVDLMSLNSAKIYGPKQAGVLFVKTGVQLQPLILGGGQQQGIRSGTENVAGIVGLTVALNSVQTIRSQENLRLTRLKQEFEKELAERLPAAFINGARAPRAPHITSLTLPGFDNERLMMELDEKGIICATGSACSASNQAPSHVLRAIGLSDELARSSLRFSLGRQTTKNDLTKTVHELERLTAVNR